MAWILRGKALYIMGEMQYDKIIFILDYSRVEVAEAARRWPMKP